MAISAVGDTVSVAGGGTSNIQPPSGEVWLVDAWGKDTDASGADGTTHISMWDGTDVARVLSSNDTTDQRRANMRLVLSNSQYARFKTMDASAIIQGYRGVKL